MAPQPTAKRGAAERAGSSWAWVDRLLFVPYFVLHIPITACIDAQGLFVPSKALAAGAPALFAFLPPRDAVFPAALTELLDWYTDLSGDMLMRAPPTWFQAIIAAEILVQLPFFFCAIYALLTQREWLRTPLLLYGAHVPTTVLPLLGTFFSPEQTLTPTQLAVLSALYLPFVFIPLLLVWRAAAAPTLFAKVKRA